MCAEAAASAAAAAPPNKHNTQQGERANQRTKVQLVVADAASATESENARGEPTSKAGRLCCLYISPPGPGRGPSRQPNLPQHRPSLAQQCCWLLALSLSLLFIIIRSRQLHSPITISSSPDINQNPESAFIRQKRGTTAGQNRQTLIAGETLRSGSSRHVF